MTYFILQAQVLRKNQTVNLQAGAPKHTAAEVLNTIQHLQISTGP
jgi:hypothetical protein